MIGKKTIFTLLTVGFLFYLWLMYPILSAKAQTSSATLSISPTNSSISSVGGNSTINVNIGNAIKLGGFEFEVHYNPAIVKVNSSSDVSLGSFLGSTGRSATLLSPVINNTDGKVKVGAFSFGSSDGPSGNGTLVTITFTAVGNGTTDITIQNELLSSSDITPVNQPTATFAGAITVGSVSESVTPTSGLGLPGDANGDGHVNIFDYVIWLVNYGNTNTPKGASVGDFNGDRSVDGIDFMIMVNNFG